MLATNDVSVQYLKSGNKPLFRKLLTELLEQNPFLFSDKNVEDILHSISVHQQEHGTGPGCLINKYGTVVGLAGLRFLPEAELYETYCSILPKYVEEVGYSMVINELVNYAFDELSLDTVCARADKGVVENELYIANGFTFLGERVFTDGGSEKIWNYYEMDNDSQLISDNNSADTDNDWDLNY